MFSNYEETISYLFSRLPVFQNQGKVAYKADLDNSLAFDKYRKYPHRSFKSIHVAGTNGKGSVSHIISSVLQARGYKVGLYTSPHLKDFRERIKINGKMVPESFVVDYVNRHHTFIDWIKPSFFEINVAMAFDYFRKEKVDYAVIETGMGGRLDSTNIISPELSVITNISLDHTQFLGDTLSKIAYEKAGIIKDTIPVVIGEATAETEAVFKEVADKRESKIVFAENACKIQKQGSGFEIDEKFSFQPDLKGNYQQKNYRTAYVALQQLGFTDDNELVKSAFEGVVKNTGLLGRWQMLKESPLIICDTAHNCAGVKLISEQLAELQAKRLLIVWGMVADKDVTSIISLLPRNAEYFLCQPDLPRKLPVDQLAVHFERNEINYTKYQTVQEAFDAAKSVQNEGDVLYVGGSTFVVAEVLP